MWFIDIMRSPRGRAIKVLVGALLFGQGAAQQSLGGLVMMMTGIVLAITALAGICLVEEAVNGWRTWHGGTPLPRRHSC
jgi:hypothetical protein